MLLSSCANQVLQEFGGVMPDNLVSFEDAMREFVAVRALELQKLGIAGTDKTVNETVLSASTRDGLLTVSGAGVTPAFVYLAPLSDSTGNTRLKVEIVPIEDIPDYENSRAVGFYGSPMRYRLAWDSWLEGTLYLWSDTIEDISTTTSGSTITFPPAFWTFLFKKTAINLIRIARLKAAFAGSGDATMQNVIAALDAMKMDLAPQVLEWQAEFRKFLNLDLNTQPHLRRSIEEIWDRGIGDVSR